MFSIKDVARVMNVKPQAIYNQKDMLLEKHYMEKTEKGYIITQTGYNYLVDKAKDSNHIKRNVASVYQKQPKENVDAETMELKKELEIFKFKLEMQEEKIRELTQQRDYFKLKFDGLDKKLEPLLLASGNQEEEHHGIFTKIKRFFV